MNAALTPNDAPFASLTVWTVRLGAPEQVVVSTSSLYTFTEAPPGLPESRRFALISDAMYAPLQWLQSLDEWEICLPVLPVAVVELDGYATDVAAAIGGGDDMDERAPIMLVTHLGESSFSVNLLAPIVLDMRTATGRQLILEGRPRYVGIADGASYPLRQQIAWNPLTGTFRPSC